MRRLLPFLFLLFAPFLCLAQQLFNEVALQSGLKQVTVANDLMGGGVAIFDYNNDGWQDIYLNGVIARDRLFKNLGNGVFKDVTLEAGGFARTNALRTMGVVTGDLDNDGFRDIIISTGRDQPQIVYRNNGDGTFTEITAEAGITSTRYSIPVVVGDYNLDGLLDIYFINYIERPRSVFDAQGAVVGFAHQCYPNDFYINEGNLKFREAAADLGVDDRGCGLAGLFTDMNGDQLPDLYIANDFGEWTGFPNAYFRNAFPGPAFVNESQVKNLNAPIYGMGIAHGDIDRDGFLDVFITNMGRNVLYRNIANDRFEDVTDQAGVGNARTPSGLYNVGWGAAFTDFDNDSWEDLYVAYGYVPGSKIIETSWTCDNKLYRNQKNNSFEDITKSSGLSDTDISRGMAVGDLDNDGDEDIIVTKLSVSTGNKAPNVLYHRNDQASGNRWLQVSVLGNSSQVNRDGFGSTIRVYHNNIVGVKSLSGGSSHASQNSSVMHFGLGTSAVIDSVEVLWPGGGRSVVKNPPVDKHILIKYGEAGYRVRGCTDPTGDNFDPSASENYGCFYRVVGCTDVNALNRNPDANVNQGCVYEEVVTSAESQNSGVEVFPNPFNRQLSVSMPTQGEYRVVLNNIQGVQMQNVNFNDQQATLELDVPPGIYLYTVYQQDRKVASGRIVRVP